MIPTLIIVFRETLEAALIVAIVLASTHGVPGRGRWVAGGVLAGLVGALVVAALGDVVAELAAGMGTELLNATVLIAAVAMLGWHQVWMGRHGAELAGESRLLGRAVSTGSRPLSALAIVCAVAVLREGSETVLFLYGVATDPESGGGAMLLGGALGAAGAATVGWLFYAGLLVIPLHLLFKVTGVIVTLLAAGMAAQAAAFLVQAGLLSPMGFDVWDTSWLVRDDGLLGRILHVLTGYVARPEGIQILFYLATIAAIALFSTLLARGGRTAKTHHA